MNIDLGAVQAGQVRYADLMRDVRYTDLYEMTDELFDTLELILAGSTNAAVLFVPRDPAASDQSEQGWTLSHVVAHLTATLEEAATVATLLARGVLVEERLRSETPWQTNSLKALDIRQCKPFPPEKSRSASAHIIIQIPPVDLKNYRQKRKGLSALR